LAQVGPGVGELLHSAVSVICGPDIALGIHGHGIDEVELPVPASTGPPLREEVPGPSGVVLLDEVGDETADVEVAGGIHGQARDLASTHAPLSIEGAVAVELLDPPGAVVGDVDEAGVIHGDAERVGELSRARAGRTELRDVVPLAAEDLDTLVAVVGHV